MRRIRNTAILGAVTAVALVGIGTGTALADPPPGTVPALTDIVGVGSDTTTPVFAGSPTEYTAGSLSYDYNHSTPTPPNTIPPYLWSWDAVNPSTGAVHEPIISKASGSGDTTCQIQRPDGSSEGITALENTTSDQGHPCVDFARSSRAPQSSDPNTIDFVAFAKDAIDYSSPAPGSGQTSPVPDNLTWQDLAEIYSCQVTNWDAFPGGGNAPIVPVLPQSGSGTRSTFLLALGGGTTPLTPGTCVVNGSNSTGPIEENTGLSDPNVAQFDPSGVPAVDDVFPDSIGDYIAQIQPAINGIGGHASPIWGHGVLELHNMNTDTGATEAPISNPTTNPTINTAWVSELDRLLYNVVHNAGTPTAPAIPSYLQPIFSSAGWLCTSAQADITSYGFLNLGRACGGQTVG